MNRFKFRIFHTFLGWASEHAIKMDADGTFEVTYTNSTNHSMFTYTHRDKHIFLMQCTNLKDKNGKLIYEGDILTTDRYPHIRDNKQNYVSVVEWCFAGFHTVLHAVNPDIGGISDGINTILEDGEEFTVIGNIHSNPELLEENNNE